MRRVQVGPLTGTRSVLVADLVPAILAQFLRVPVRVRADTLEHIGEDAEEMSSAYLAHAEPVPDGVPPVLVHHSGTVLHAHRHKLAASLAEEARSATKVTLFFPSKEGALNHAPVLQGACMCVPLRIEVAVSNQSNTPLRIQLFTAHPLSSLEVACGIVAPRGRVADRVESTLPSSGRWVWPDTPAYSSTSHQAVPQGSRSERPAFAQFPLVLPDQPAYYDVPPQTSTVLSARQGSGMAYEDTGERAQQLLEKLAPAKAAMTVRFPVRMVLDAASFHFGYRYVPVLGATVTPLGAVTGTLAEQPITLTLTQTWQIRDLG